MIDIDELRDIVRREESDIFWRNHELAEKDIEIAKLKEKTREFSGIEHYHSGRGQFNIPMTDRVEISAMSHKRGLDKHFDDEIIHELDIAGLLAIGSLCGVCGFWILITMESLFVS